MELTMWFLRIIIRVRALDRRMTYRLYGKAAFLGDLNRSGTEAFRVTDTHSQQRDSCFERPWYTRR